jgi:hypothetical protein
MAWKDDEDDWPEPIQDPEELERAQRAYDRTFLLRRKMLNYGSIVLAVLVVLVIILAATR